MVTTSARIKQTVVERDLDEQPQFTQHVVLENITWQTYQLLLLETGDRRAVRFCYNRGILEIVMPLDVHEAINRLLEKIISAITFELGLSIKSFGSTTLNREDLSAGAEPDSCFYIQNARKIKGRKLNLQNDPPPDLAVEVDITSSSRFRFTTYKHLGIPETWRYTAKEGIKIYQLQNNEYIESEFSPTFPMLSGTVINQFLQKANQIDDDMDDNEIIRAVISWLREQPQ